MKNNQSAIQFANEFIENLKESKNNFDFSKEMDVVINKEILSADKNLAVLRNELKKIGFNLLPTEKQNCWTLRKIQ